MAKILFPRKEIEKFVKLDEATLERINLFGTTVEQLTQTELELEISANRPDLFSTQGFLRSFLAFIGKEKGARSYPVAAWKAPFSVKVDKSVKGVRPYTACAVVRNLSLNSERVEELIRLQERIHLTIGRKRKRCAVGIYPLDKIAFPIKYEARKPADISFVPLGASKAMSASQILQKHPTGKEYAHLLTGDRYPVFVDSKNSILSMPPVINSDDTGRITEQTRDVFVECSGSEPGILKTVITLLVTTMADMGGSIQSVKVEDEVMPSLAPVKMKFNKKRALQLLGLSLSDKELEACLAKMGHKLEKDTVVVPAWRSDIIHEVDLVEDIAIGYGYDKFVPEKPSAGTVGKEDSQNGVRRDLIALLTGLGFLETSSLHFIKLDEADKMNFENVIEVESAKTEYKALRPNLLIPALRTLSENVDAAYPQKICEIGTIFRADDEEETRVAEHEHLIIATTPGNATEVKQILEYLCNAFGLQYSLKDAKPHGFIDGRAASIHFGSEHAGVFGEIHPSVLAAWKLKMPLAVLEIDLGVIYNALKKR